MRSNTKVLGWLWIVLGGLGVIAGVLALVVLLGTGLLVNERDVTVALTIVGIIVAVIVTLISVPCIVAGIGLQKLRPWSRVLALVLAFFSLLNFPLGTVLAVYTFASLLNQEAGQLFGS